LYLVGYVAYSVHSDDRSGYVSHSCKITAHLRRFKQDFNTSLYFFFAFHRKYASVLYGFRTVASCVSKVAHFPTPGALAPRLSYDPFAISALSFMAFETTYDFILVCHCNNVPVGLLSWRVVCVILYIGLRLPVLIELRLVSDRECNTDCNILVCTRHFSPLGPPCVSDVSQSAIGYVFQQLIRGLSESSSVVSTWFMLWPAGDTSMSPL